MNFLPGRSRRPGGTWSTLRDASDPFVHLDEGEPFADMSDSDRAKLHASLDRAEKEIAAGESVPAEDLLRELRARR